MNNQTETIKPGAVSSGAISNNAGTATNAASTEPVSAVADKPKTATDQGDAGNAQTTNQSDVEKQVKPDVPTSVKLELSEEGADMIQTTTDQPVAKELTQNEFWISGMLNGTFYECDGPYYTTKDIPAESYPFTTTKPNPNFTSQKYDYINHKWVDTSADALLHKMESISTAINGLQQATATLQQGFASQSQAQEAKDEETERIMGLLNMIVKQVGAISNKIGDSSTKLNENSAATPAPKAAPATAPASTTAPVVTAAPAGSTTQKAPATPAATTTQTADETKKEGTN